MVPNAGLWADYCRQVIRTVQGFRAGALEKVVPAFEGALLHEYPLRVGRRGPHFSGPSRRSHTTGMKSKVHPRYKTKYRVANWAAYNQALVRRGDVTVWVSTESDRCLDARPEWPAGRAAALLESRHRDRPDPAAPLPSPAAPSRRIPARSVRDDAPRPRRPRLYDALPAQSAFEAPSATGPARRGPPSCARQHGAVHRRGR